MSTDEVATRRLPNNNNKNNKVRSRMSAAALFGLVGMTLAVVGPASPAQASAADCERGANGFVDIRDDLRGAHAPPAKWNGRVVDRRPGQRKVKVHLYYGTVKGAQRGWAMIDGDTRPGDWVWMEYSINGGESVKITCGPFSVDANGRSKTSAAKMTSKSSSVMFRACARMVGTPPSSARCTGWW